MTKCRSCESNDLIFSKHIHYGPITGKTYHYQVECLSCRRKYGVKRCKEIYEKVKDKQWELSGTCRRMQRLENEKPLRFNTIVNSSQS